MNELSPPAVDSPALRQAGGQLLSLALIDARNHTLQWLTAWEQAAQRQDPAGLAGLPQVLDIAQRIGALADRWIVSPGGGVDRGAAPVDSLRSGLMASLEATLELLDAAPDDDAGLRLFRAVLFHEDACGEQLTALAQAHGLQASVRAPAALAWRPPLWLPARRWMLGSAEGGFSFDLERPAHAVEVPEFEIDAQPVDWARFVEFVDDGGYDRQELWHPEGWDWVQDQGRRAPAHVAQIGGGGGAVLAHWFGKSVRLSPSQPVVHASWWEADAWARWAGRRLPTEAEWEIAALTAANQGFRWGEVHEWMAGSLRPWEGYLPDAWSTGTWLDPQPYWGRARVRRGASLATRGRLKHPRLRGFGLPDADQAFVGFRSCAV
ncbi:MAG: SUMF1/EgtB/PvdO family nonheme iron enzyme [Pseudomonadota bacterium]